MPELTGPSQSPPPASPRTGRREGPLPVLTCEHCGGTWFREVRVHSYPKWQLPFDQPSTHLQLKLAICLCGRPNRPNLGGVQRVPTAQDELSLLRTSLDREPAHNDPDRFDLLRGAKAERKEFDDLLKRISKVRSAIEVIQRRLRMRRRYRDLLPPVKRRAATAGKDKLVLAVQEQGFEFRKARAAVDAVVDIWKRALSAGDEIEIPGGTVSTRPAKGWKMWNRKQLIQFTPADPFDIGGIPMPRRPSISDNSRNLCCEECRGTHFISTDFQQYVGPQYSATPGGELHPITDGSPLPALVCVCGRAIPVGRAGRKPVRDPQVDKFQHSLKLAQYYRSDERWLEARFRWRTEFVDRPEFAEAVQMMSRLEQSLAALSAPAPKDPPRSQKNQRGK